MDSGVNAYNMHKHDDGFTQAYLLKMFSQTLSKEYQETLTLREKFSCLEQLRDFAKKKKFKKSLIHVIDHELISLTVKLEEFDEKRFKDYLNSPIENFRHFRPKTNKYSKHNGPNKH